MKLTTLDLFYQLSKPFIFKLDLDAETMHNLALKQIRKIKPHKEKYNRTYELFGYKFSSPLILAAGFGLSNLFRVIIIYPLLQE